VGTAREPRWALLENPGDLTDEQAVTLRKLKRRGGDLWRAYALKEALRVVFAGDLDEGEVGLMLGRFSSRAQRSGPKPFVTSAKTIRKRRASIIAAVRLGINNTCSHTSLIGHQTHEFTHIYAGSPRYRYVTIRSFCCAGTLPPVAAAGCSHRHYLNRGVESPQVSWV